MKKKKKKSKTARSSQEYDDNRFTFDSVFSLRSSQHDVYVEAAAPMAGEYHDIILRFILFIY